MEVKVFPSPAVAAELENFIEARLHTDGGPRLQDNKALQLKLTGSVANPIYVVVDPKSEEGLRVRAGYMTAERFVAFLRGTE